MSAEPARTRVYAGGDGGENMTQTVRLRPLALGDEAEFRQAHETMASTDGFEFGLGYDDGLSWTEYLTALQDLRRGINVPDDRVPGTFLVADVGGVIVGRASIRHRLNHWLAEHGGHVGYGVLPAHRRKGYATQILCQSMVIARAQGIERALLICDDDNVASIRVIERCGGVLESAVEGGIRRYWID